MDFTCLTALALISQGLTSILFIIAFLTDFMIDVGIYEHYGLFNSILEDEPWWKATQALMCTSLVCMIIADFIYIVAVCCTNCGRRAILTTQFFFLFVAGCCTTVGVIVFAINLPEAYVLRFGSARLDFCYYLFVVSAAGFLLSAVLTFVDSRKVLPKFM